jgi:hypothetical protein
MIIQNRRLSGKGKGFRQNKITLEYGFAGSYPSGWMKDVAFE